MRTSTILFLVTVPVSIAGFVFMEHDPHNTLPLLIVGAIVCLLWGFTLSLFVEGE